MYKMMTAKEIIDLLFDNRELNFTFDDIDIDATYEPSGWHGIKIITVFDNDMLVIGYYGGGATTSINTPFFDDTEKIKKLYTKALQKYMDNECEWNGKCKKVCVELTKQNN